MRRITRQDRRLALKKETLRALDRRLDDAALARVAGGSGDSVDSSGCGSLPCPNNSGASLSGSVKCPDSYRCG